MLCGFGGLVAKLAAMFRIVRDETRLVSGANGAEPLAAPASANPVDAAAAGSYDDVAFPDGGGGFDAAIVEL